MKRREKIPEETNPGGVEEEEEEVKIIANFWSISMIRQVHGFVSVSTYLDSVEKSNCEKRNAAHMNVIVGFLLRCARARFFLLRSSCSQFLVLSSGQLAYDRDENKFSFSAPLVIIFNQITLISFFSLSLSRFASPSPLVLLHFRRAVGPFGIFFLFELFLLFSATNAYLCTACVFFCVCQHFSCNFKFVETRPTETTARKKT